MGKKNELFKDRHPPCTLNGTVLKDWRLFLSRDKNKVALAEYYTNCIKQNINKVRKCLLVVGLVRNLMPCSTKKMLRKLVLEEICP